MMRPPRAAPAQPSRQRSRQPVVQALEDPEELVGTRASASLHTTRHLSPDAAAAAVTAACPCSAACRVHASCSNWCTAGVQQHLGLMPGGRTLQVRAADRTMRRQEPQGQPRRQPLRRASSWGQGSQRGTAGGHAGNPFARPLAAAPGTSDHTDGETAASCASYGIHSLRWSTAQAAAAICTRPARNRHAHARCHVQALRWSACSARRRMSRPHEGTQGSACLRGARCLQAASAA